MELLKLANIPLLWEDSPRVSLMKFIKPPSKMFCEVNAFNTIRRKEFKDKLRDILAQQIENYEF